MRENMDQKNFEYGHFLRSSSSHTSIDNSEVMSFILTF